MNKKLPELFSDWRFAFLNILKGDKVKILLGFFIFAGILF